MSLAHETVVFDVLDAKVYALLTDPVGASPTYGAAVDVPGIADVSVDPNMVTAELKGDSRIIAKKGRIDRFNFSATYGKFSTDVLGVILGATTTVTGSTNVRLRSASPAPLPYFKLEFKIEDLDVGVADLHCTLYKCQLTGGTLLGTSSDNFGQPTMQGEAIALTGASIMAEWNLYSTVQSLSA